MAGSIGRSRGRERCAANNYTQLDTINGQYVHLCVHFAAFVIL